MAHTHDKLCLTVTAVLVRENKVLLLNHPTYDLWLAVGGHIDAGEDPTEALYREIKEETGYEPSEIEVFGTKPAIQFNDENGASFLVPPTYISRHSAADREHVSFVYLVKVIADRDVSLSDEHTEARWLTEEELPGLTPLLLDRVKFYCHEALRSLATG